MTGCQRSHKSPSCRINTAFVLVHGACAWRWRPPPPRLSLVAQLPGKSSPTCQVFLDPARVIRVGLAPFQLGHHGTFSVTIEVPTVPRSDDQPDDHAVTPIDYEVGITRPTRPAQAQPRELEGPDDILPLVEEERRIIMRALTCCSWDVSHVAKRLGMSRATSTAGSANLDWSVRGAKRAARRPSDASSSPPVGGARAAAGGLVSGPTFAYPGGGGPNKITGKPPLVQSRHPRWVARSPFRVPRSRADRHRPHAGVRRGTLPGDVRGTRCHPP